MIWLASSDPLSHVVRHDLPLHIGPIIVSNQMLMAVVAGAIMLALFPVIFGKVRPEAPSGLRNFFETIMEFLRAEVFRPALKEHTDRFVPFLWTIFFFILFCNLLGQIPIAELITLATGKQSHIGGTATGTLTTTGALAALAFLFIHFNGIFQVARSLMDGTYGHHAHHEEPAPAAGHAPQGHTAHGDASDLHHPGHAQAHAPGMGLVPAALMAVPLYLWNFAPHPFKPGPGQPSVLWIADIFMWAVLLCLELVGAVIKPFALMIRLFANMIAGHIVLAALVMLIPLTAGVFAQIGIGLPVTVLSLLIRVLELFVSFLQAYIFTFLTTLFIASAVAPEH